MLDTPEPTPLWKTLLTIAKDIIPIVSLLVVGVYGYATRSITNDRSLQEQREDRVTIRDISGKLSEETEKLAGVSAKVDLLITAMFRQEWKEVRGADKHPVPNR